MGSTSDRNIDVLIIGAGTAGLSALSEVSKVTDDFLIVDPGPLGTTCARVGCMPSKALIEIAESFFQAKTQFACQGILGAHNLIISVPQVLSRVRELRDFFTSGLIERIEKLGNNYLCGQAHFLSQNIVAVGDIKIKAKKIIIATGSSPVMPQSWGISSNQVLTTDTLFEQHDLCKNIAVIGAGPIGIEMAQALSRLGITIFLFHSKNLVAGITDPVVNKCAIHIFRKEFKLVLNERVEVEKNDEYFKVISSNQEMCVDQVLVALGRRPNLENLMLQNTKIKLNDNGLPKYSKKTLRVENTNIYLAGDVSDRHPILHEAADEGHIAGYNAVSSQDQCIDFRVPIEIIFAKPNIAKVGLSYESVQDDNHVIGEAYFDNQGRARIMSENSGVLRIYAKTSTGVLVGSEMIMPSGEHIVHLLAFAIQRKLTVFDLLEMPFYHPTIEEGFRTALRDLSKKLPDVAATRSYSSLCDSVAAIELERFM